LIVEVSGVFTCGGCVCYLFFIILEVTKSQKNWQNLEKNEQYVKMEDNIKKKFIFTPKTSNTTNIFVNLLIHVQMMKLFSQKLRLENNESVTTKKKYTTERKTWECKSITKII